MVKDESLLFHHIPETELVSKYPFWFVESKHCENEKKIEKMKSELTKSLILGIYKNKKTRYKNGFFNNKI